MTPSEALALARLLGSLLDLDPAELRMSIAALVAIRDDAALEPQTRRRARRAVLLRLLADTVDRDDTPRN